MRLARLLNYSLTLSLTLTLTITLSACGDDVSTVDDDVGSATESTDAGDSTDASTDETGSSDSTEDSTDSTEDSTDATDTTDTTDSTETTGGGICDANDVVDVDITLALTGSQAPPNGCGDHLFTGTLQGGGGGNWMLDACPCGAQCLIPDPYALSIVVPDVDALPLVPNCPSIELRRNADCEVVSITITDPGQLDGAMWIGSRENADRGTVADVVVNDSLVGVCDCPDCDPPTLYQLGFESQGETLLLSEGENGEVGDWTAYSFSSHTYAVGDTDHYAWVMKRSQ